jgi:hypothetical protein
MCFMSIILLTPLQKIWSNIAQNYGGVARLGASRKSNVQRTFGNLRQGLARARVRERPGPSTAFL